MRLGLYSDLHLEFAPFAPPPGLGADVVVLAGDTQTKRRGVRWARAAFPGTPVVYVGGNHEHYGDRLPNTTNALRVEGAGVDVHVLENESVVLHGVRFLGCTLWTDLCLDSPVPDTATAEHWMNDYRRIRLAPTYRRLHARDTAAMHARSVRWLTAALAEPHPGPTVVVTHHAPSARSIDPERRSDPAGLAYASHLDDLVARSGAALWLHGHTHYCVDYTLGTTRVLANPRGYPDEPATGMDGRRFDPAFIVELP